MKLSRRKFLKLGATTAVALGASPCIIGCDGSTSSTNPGKSTVAAVKGNNLTTMTHEVLEGLGGISDIVHEGETVFIKPNMVTLPWAPSYNCFHVGECTKPEIIIAVMEACLQAGASEVVVGDGSQQYVFDWHYATTLDGSTDLVQEAARLSAQYGRPVSLACLETDSPQFVDIPSCTQLGAIAVSSLMTDADRVISLPVAKTHSWAQLTLGLKNFIGTTSIARYGQRLYDDYWVRSGGLDHSSPEAIAQVYLDVVASIQPDLVIIDFSIGIEGDGPTAVVGGKTVDVRDRLGAWMLLAGTDIMAVDVTAARIMSQDIAQINYLQMGYEMGLGEISVDAIELVGEKLADLQMNWAPAVIKPRNSHHWG